MVLFFNCDDVSLLMFGFVCCGYSHMKELGFRFTYCFYAFLGSWMVFLYYSSYWLEFIVVSFSSCASGVFFSFSSLAIGTINFSLFLAFLFVVPFCIFQSGFYFLPSLYKGEQSGLVLISFSMGCNLLMSIWVLWGFLMPMLYGVLISWFSMSGLAMTYIPEFTAFVWFILFVFSSIVLFLQLPCFLFLGFWVEVWDIMSLSVNRMVFYFISIMLGVLWSPLELLFCFFLVMVLVFFYECTLFFLSFFFISKVFVLIIVNMMDFIVCVNGHFILISGVMTIFQVCEATGCYIPHFCYQPLLNIAGNCRMCLVSVYGMGKPVVSCTMFVSEGMFIYTTSFFVKKVQESVLEFLLLNHPLDCPVCDQGGMCDLQEQSFHYGSSAGRFFGLKRSIVNKDLGPVVSTVMNRCIQCTRCVRFLEGFEVDFGIVGSFLFMGGRGSTSEITTYYSFGSLGGLLVGNVVDLCPVGALTKKPYSFVGRPWESRTVTSYDLSSGSMKKVYFSKLVDSAFISVSSFDGSWISDYSRFAYDAFSGFNPFSFGEEGSYKLSMVGSMVLGSDLSLMDLVAVSFYWDGLSYSSDVFSCMPVVDNTRSYLWGWTVDESVINFDFIVIVGAGITCIAPSLFAELRKSFCLGSSIVNFGPVSSDLMLVSCGNRLSDFISFVLGYHKCCLFFSVASKSLLLFITSLFSSVYSALWMSLVDKLYSLGYFISFINVFANEVGYYYSSLFGRVNTIDDFSFSVLFSKSVSVFGYVDVITMEFLWFFCNTIEFYCGSWPTVGGLCGEESRFYQTAPLVFQNAPVCTSLGEMVTTVSLKGVGGSMLLHNSISDILVLSLGVKYWTVPMFSSSKVFVISSNWVEPFDFHIQLVSWNGLLEFPLGWVPLLGWVERSKVGRQFCLFSEYVEFNF